MSPYSFDSLRKISLFVNSSERVLKKISKITDEMILPAGSVILREGDVGHEFLMILEGTARVEKDGKVLRRLSANDFLGEVSLIDKKPRSAEIIAETDLRLLVVGSEHFDYLLEIVPGLWREIALALCRYIRG